MNYLPPNHDVYGPLLSPGAQPPGQWVTGDAGQPVWSGAAQWRTSAGSATICWSHGDPRWVYNASLHDGAIAPFIEKRFAATNRWRRPRADRGYILGAIRILPNAVLFTDGEQPRFTPLPLPAGDQAPDLEAELGHDAEFLSLIKDDAATYAILEWLRNRDMRKARHANRWSIAPRQLAQFLADVRSIGENDADILSSGHFAPSQTARFTSILSRLGWREITAAENSADYAAARAMIAEAELRPATFRPVWALNLDASTARDAVSRMTTAATKGQITLNEWAILINLLGLKTPTPTPRA